MFYYNKINYNFNTGIVLSRMGNIIETIMLSEPANDRIKLKTTKWSVVGGNIEE